MHTIYECTTYERRDRRAWRAKWVDAVSPKDVNTALGRARLMDQSVESKSATTAENHSSRKRARKLFPIGYRKGIDFGTGKPPLPTDLCDHPDVWA